MCKRAGRDSVQPQSHFHSAAAPTPVKPRHITGLTTVMWGNDYPHAEGLAAPLSFVDDLPGFSDDEIRLVMRENALGLSVPRV